MWVAIGIVVAVVVAAAIGCGVSLSRAAALGDEMQREWRGRK